MEGQADFPARLDSNSVCYTPATAEASRLAVRMMSAAPSKPEALTGTAAQARLDISERAVYACAFGVFAVAAIVTLYFGRSMSGGMPMPGNWTMGMMWMSMPGEDWISAGVMFAGMWLAMMVAMMLPSTLPMLLLYRRAQAFRRERGLARLTFALGAGYFLVWLLFGVAAYAAGRGVTRAAMAWDSVSKIIPLATAIALIVAGVYQLTRWKSACLKHCRDPLGQVAQHLEGGWRGALRLGLHHGAFCAACCWALMLIQLALGVMNLIVMVAVALVIALEKLLARGETIARIIGVASILGGVTLGAVWALNL